MSNRHTAAIRAWPSRTAVLVVFSIAFGLVEAAIVVHLRVVYDPIRHEVHPERPPESLLPLVTLDELRETGEIHARQLIIELGREFATMVMLITVAMLGARRKGEWIAFYMIAFGVWDIVYYIGLKAMIDFPESLLTWDILFLLPVPWLGPVLAPVLVSVSIIAAGLIVLSEVDRGYPLRGHWLHWTLIALGGFIVIVSFAKDYPETLKGGMPEPYNWFIFSAGEGVGMAAFAHMMWAGRKRGA